MRVLVAEDSPIFLELLRTTLSDWGYQVEEARDGREAWRALQARDAPRLVVLDWMMPGLDGVEICRRFRASGSPQITYIVLLTARGRPEDVVAGLEAGADDYVTKPFDVRELRARLQVGARIIELHRVKNEMLSVLSHELRNPLTGILSGLELLRATPLDDGARRIADIVHRSSERMLRLVGALLDVERIESGRVAMDLERVLLAPLVTLALDGIRPGAQANDVELALDNGCPGAVVEVDADRLLQVLTNLLSNALKYSAGGDRVAVRITPAEAAVRIAVTDWGPGIPEDFRPQVFQKFARAGGDGRAGTGLGLSIAKAIVESLGGAIGFDTEIGVGTTFYFTLPLAPE